jgi:hypothetical protein
MNSLLIVFGWAFVIQIIMIVIFSSLRVILGFLDKITKINNMKTMVLFEKTLAGLKNKNIKKEDIDGLVIPGIPKGSPLESKLKDFLKEENILKEKNQS